MTGSSTRLGHRSLPRVSKRRELPRGSRAGGARAQRPGPHYSAAWAAGAAEAAGAAKAAVFGGESGQPSARCPGAPQLCVAELPSEAHVLGQGGGEYY